MYEVKILKKEGSMNNTLFEKMAMKGDINSTKVTDVEELKNLLKTFDYDKNSNEDLFDFLCYIVDNFLKSEYISKTYLENLYDDIIENNYNSTMFDKPTDIIEDIIAYMEGEI